MPKEFFTAEWFPYYVERFEESDRVSLMTLTDEGAYHIAIRQAWKKKWLPAAPEVLAAKIGKRCTIRTAENILKTFMADPERPGKVIHPVVEEIRDEQEQKFLIKRKGGKAAAEKRKLNSANKGTLSTTEFCSSTSPTRIENTEDSSNEESRIVSVGTAAEVESGKLKTESFGIDQEPPIREMFTGTVIAELEKRLDVKSLPSKLEWQRSADWAFENGFTSDQFLECHELLKKQHWRDGPVKPKHVCENLPNLQKLRDEIAKQSGKSGQSRKSGKATAETSAEVIERLGVV